MAAVEPADDDIRKPEAEQRIRYAEKLIARQVSGRGIAAELMSRFDCVERTARTYIAIAYQRLQAAADEDRGIRKARMRRTLQGMLRHHMAKGDRTAANRAADMLCRLDGLYAPEKLELTTTVGIALEMRHVMNALDERGLDALQIVMDQLEAKGIKALPSGSDELIIDIDDDGELVDPPPIARPRRRSER